MRLIMVPMVAFVVVGLKTFLDYHLVLIPILCVFAFILGFIFLVKWNVERLRGSR
jgi:hypothetical protein